MGACFSSPAARHGGASGRSTASSIDHAQDALSAEASSTPDRDGAPSGLCAAAASNANRCQQQQPSSADAAAAAAAAPSLQQQQQQRRRARDDAELVGRVVQKVQGLFAGWFGCVVGVIGSCWGGSSPANKHTLPPSSTHPTNHTAPPTHTHTHTHPISSRPPSHHHHHHQQHAQLHALQQELALVSTHPLLALPEAAELLTAALGCDLVGCVLFCVCLCMRRAFVARVLL